MVLANGTSVYHRCIKRARLLTLTNEFKEGAYEDGVVMVHLLTYLPGFCKKLRT